MHFRFTGLWRHSDFRKLWAGQTVSVFGSQITFLALPLTAVLVLDATPAQMGFLTAVGGLPALLTGLLAGAWIDRRHRRPIMIAADWGRAALLLVVPIAHALGVLHIGLLYVVSFGLGTFGLFFSIAYRSLLPSLVGREQIVEANSKLELSRSGGEVAAPGIGGLLVQIATAPIALLIDAFTFVVSALLLQSMRTPEPERAPPEQRESLWKEAGEGLRVVVRNPVLRGLAGCAGTISLFSTLLETVALLYMTHQLDLNPGLIGLIFTVGGGGLVVGALLAERVTRWIGLGPALIGGVMLIAAADLVLPVASGPLVAIVVLLAIGHFLFGVGLIYFNIGQVSLRQVITPDRLQGRMNATMTVVLVGTVPIGAILGGALGETIGLRPTLFVAVAGELLAVSWLLLSPVRSLHELEAPSANV